MTIIMIVLQIISLLFWLLVIPFVLGFWPAILIPEKDRTPGTIFLSGYIVLFALFELIGIPVTIVCVYNGFSILTVWFGVIAVLLAVAGVFLML